MEFISAFDLDIRYKPGKDNVVADANVAAVGSPAWCRHARRARHPTA